MVAAELEHLKKHSILLPVQYADLATQFYLSDMELILICRHYKLPIGVSSAPGIFQ